MKSSYCYTLPAINALSLGTWLTFSHMIESILHKNSFYSKGFFHPNDQMQANITLISDFITAYKSIGM